MSIPYDLIETAELAVDPVAKRKALKTAIAQMMAMDVSSADVAYALGYAWYLMPDDAQERLMQAEQHLRVALRTMPKHLYARLYLAHCYFDSAVYADALSLLSNFECDAFEKKGQAWRDVKVAELALACALELRRATLIPKAIEELLNRVNRVDADSVPVPEELTRTLQRLIVAT